MASATGRTRRASALMPRGSGERSRPHERSSQRPRQGRAPIAARARAGLGWSAGFGLLTVLLLLAWIELAVARPASTPAAPPQTEAQSPEDGLRAPDILRILKRGELVVAMVDLDTPPFFYLREGKLVGLEVDMAKELAEALAVRVRFDRRARSFNQVVDLVARHEADLGISKLSRTLARAESVRFSNPYLRLKHALALNRVAVARLTKDRPIQALVRDFRGTLGVIQDSAFADFAVRHFPHAEIRGYRDWGSLVQAVERGEILAAYRDELEVKRLLHGDPSAPLTLRTVTLTDLEDTLGIAVNRGDPDLLQLVNLFLAQRQTQLTLEQVLRSVAH